MVWGLRTVTSVTSLLLVSTIPVSPRATPPPNTPSTTGFVKTRTNARPPAPNRYPAHSPKPPPNAATKGQPMMTTTAIAPAPATVPTAANNHEGRHADGVQG